MVTSSDIEFPPDGNDCHDEQYSLQKYPAWHFRTQRREQGALGDRGVDR